LTWLVLESALFAEEGERGKGKERARREDEDVTEESESGEGSREAVDGRGVVHGDGEDGAEQEQEEE